MLILGRMLKVVGTRKQIIISNPLHWTRTSDLSYWKSLLFGIISTTLKNSNHHTNHVPPCLKFREFFVGNQKKVIELEDEESKCSEKKNEEESDSDDDENDGVSKNQEVVVHNNDEESECSEEESDSDDDENDGVSDYEPSSHESDFEEEAEEDWRGRGKCGGTST